MIKESIKYKSLYSDFYQILNYSMTESAHPIKREIIIFNEMNDTHGIKLIFYLMN